MVTLRYWAMWTTDGTFSRTYNSDGTSPPATPPQHLRIQTERAGFLGQVIYKFD